MALHRSQLVPAIYPIEPITDSLLGCSIFRQWLQLHQRYSDSFPALPNPDKHFRLALLLRCHAQDFHFFSNLEKGDWAGDPTARLERNFSLPSR